MNPEDEDTTPAGTEPAEHEDPAGTEPAEHEDPAGAEPAPAGDEDPADEDEDQPAGDEDEDEDGDSFPRSYVKRLRERSAGYRARAKTAEGRVTELERALFTERVRALDVLADPADLPYDGDLLEDPDAMRSAVDALVRERPHYRRRGTADPSSTGSRHRSSPSDTVSLSAIMRGHA